jgi:hypothetical protein
MGGARHSARRSEFTIERKLRRTIIETERLLSHQDLTSQTNPLFATICNSNTTRTAIPNCQLVWIGDGVLDFAQAA